MRAYEQLFETTRTDFTLIRWDALDPVVALPVSDVPVCPIVLPDPVVPVEPEPVVPLVDPLVPVLEVLPLVP